jgi:hypothetical protein
MKIDLLKREHLTDYEDLVMTYGSIFNSPGWIALFGESVRVYLITDDSGKIAGSFLVYELNHFGIRYSRCAPFTPSNALFLVTGSGNNSKIGTLQKKIFKHLAEFYDSNLRGIIKVSFPVVFFDFQPFIWKKFKVIPNYTYRHNLECSLDEIFSSFSPEKRSEIRKVQKDGIEVVQQFDYSIILKLVQDTFFGNSIRFSSEVLGKIFQEFANETNSFSYISRDGDRILSYTFCLFDSKTAYYIFGGNPVGERHPGAGSATLWESIKKSKELGLSFFDFEGSMIPDVEKYFRGFGGALTPYFTVNKANIILEIALKFIKREYF